MTVKTCLNCHIFVVCRHRVNIYTAVNAKQFHHIWRKKTSSNRKVVLQKDADNTIDGTREEVLEIMETKGVILYIRNGQLKCLQFTMRTEGLENMTLKGYIGKIEENSA